MYGGEFTLSLVWTYRSCATKKRSANVRIAFRDNVRLFEQANVPLGAQGKEALLNARGIEIATVFCGAGREASLLGHNGVPETKKENSNTWVKPLAIESSLAAKQVFLAEMSRSTRLITNSGTSGAMLFYHPLSGPNTRRAPLASLTAFYS